MNNIILIGLGGAIGSICRYGLANGIYVFVSRDFPYGTLAVNILGCFLMGLLFTLLLTKFNGIAEQLRALLLIGFLGGFTTFSAFSIETLMLFENGNIISGFLNIMVSCVFGLGAVWLGLVIGRSFGNI